MEFKPVMGKLLPLLLLLFSAVGYAEPVTEHAVKAAIALKITKFVSWPATSDAENQQMRFCVAGGDSILAELRKLQVNSVQGRSLTTRDVSSPGEVLGACDVLYLGRDLDAEQIWLDEISSAPVLTFGEAQSGGESDNIVLISIRDNKVRFSVNVAASEKAGLTIGAQLLQLAAMGSGR